MLTFTRQEQYNINPTSEKNSIVVRAGIFNKLVDALNTLFPTSTKLSVATLAVTNPIIQSVGTVAAAGTNQATAGAITAETTIVTAADDAKGVILPNVYVGACYKIYSTVVTKALKIYPASGEKLNGGTADASVTITPVSGATGGVICIYKTTGDWYVYPISGALS